MPTELRIALVVVALAWNIGVGFWLERRIHRRLAAMAGGSIGRAVAVTVGYLFLVAVGWVAFGIAAAVVQELAGGVVAPVLVCFAALVLVGPFSWALMSPASPDTGGRATVRRELRSAGADPRTATTIGCLGAVLSLVTGVLGLILFAILVLVLGRP